MNFYPLYAYFFPARSGELTMVPLLRQHAGVRPAEGLAALVVVRLSDLAVLLATYLVLFALFIGDMPFALTPERPAWAVTILGVVLLGAWVLRIVWVRRRRAVAGSFSRAEAWLPAFIRSWRHDLVEHFRLVHERGIYFGLFWRTVLIQVFKWAVFYLVVRAAGFDISVANLIVVSLFHVISFMVQSPGNFGTQEIGYVAAFVMFGMATARAITLSLGIHLLQMQGILVYALFSLLCYRWWGGRGEKAA